MFWRKPKQIRAEAFELTDESGRCRARLGTEEDGSVVLTFLDEQGKARMTMGLTDSGTPRVNLSYAEGKGSIQLEANDELNSAAVTVTGVTGVVNVLLGVSSAGEPAFGLFDKKGRCIYSPGLGRRQDTESWTGEEWTANWDDMLRRFRKNGGDVNETE